MNLQVSRLAFGYPGKRVGADVSFALNGGEVLCLLGPNGSGKTTLFKTVLGLLPVQGGSIRLNGEDVTGWSRVALARAMGYVPQAHTAYFPFSVLEAVLMGRTPHIGPFGTPGPRDIQVARRALQTLNIGHLSDAAYTEISGGERQLTLIARALAQEPALLVMDEPTASLDFGNQMLVLEQVRRLATAGMGIILSTHDPDHAFQCADQAALLQGGSLVALGPPGDVVTSPNLRQLYGVDVEVVALPERVPGAAAHVCVPRQMGH